MTMHPTNSRTTAAASDGGSGLRVAVLACGQMRRPVDVTVTASTSAGPEAAFDAIAPIDLAAVFDRFLLVPGVRGVRDQTGSWDTAGRTRVVLLSNGSEVPERLTMVDRPRAFAYRVGPFPRPLGLLVAHADGDWAFTTDAHGGTAIRWTYRFSARPGRRAIVATMLAPLWRAYARQAVDRCVAAAERHAACPELGDHVVGELTGHGRASGPQRGSSG